MKFYCLLILICIACVTNIYAVEKNEDQKIIFIRHGEKPLDKEIGQLSCQGLNRSLKIANVLIKKFGKPDYIFAPDPGVKIGKKGKRVSYIRPLSTIAPTAIKLGMPINAEFGYSDITGVSEKLLKEDYNNSLVFVSWEHKKLVDIVKYIFKKDKNNSPDIIPEWPEDDYDSIYILDVKKENNLFQISFSQDQQNLNHESKDCP